MLAAWRGPAADVEHRGVVTDLVGSYDERVAVAAALSRAVLLARTAIATTAAVVSLRLVGDPVRVGLLVGFLAATGAGQVAVLTRWPRVVAAPVAVVALDSVLLLVVLALAGGGLPYFAFLAGSAALSGVLLGLPAVLLWAAQAAQATTVAATLLLATRPDPALVSFVLAAPTVCILAGIAGAFATQSLVRQLQLSVLLVGAAQRTAAARERARLARELHDSVAKTLHGISLAALALPHSVRRAPRLAEQLADSISQSAAAADQQTRELLGGLRLDSPDVDFATSVHRLSRAWSAESGIPVDVRAPSIELPVAVRYELTRIVHEGLSNVDRHAEAGRVVVELASGERSVSLTVRDDGRGFAGPRDVQSLQAAGHLGIIGMMERARSVGGELELITAPGQGTTVRVWLPLRVDGASP
jgi:signal transduction histidine kinase